MNYIKIYSDLILSRKSRIIDNNTYTQKHHIKPKFIEEDNSDDNLVNLTIREHLLAHWLLWRIHGNMSAAYAFSYISKVSLNLSKLMGKDGIVIRKSYAHIEAKEAHAFANANKEKSNHDIKRKHRLSEERKLEISEFFKGKEKTKSQREKIGASNSISLRGRKMSDDEKIKRNHREKVYGQQRSEETLIRMRNARKNKMTTEERIKTITEKQLDFSNNEWLKILSDEWHMSQSGVRYWVKKYFPEKYFINT